MPYVVNAQKPLVAILMTLMLFSSVSSIHGQSVPKAEITRLTCPSQVSAGDPFVVNVSIQYSFEGWTFADLGVFQENFTNILDDVHYYLTGDVLRNFTLIEVAPSTSSDLHLRLVTRYWYQEFWITDAEATKDCFVKVLGSSEKLAMRPSIVRIGENKWYYWNNNASDALLIWLTGGHAFSDHVTVNPYDMEGFGVMRFIGDLSRNYSVLALQSGSEEHTVAVMNQPYYALGYYPGSTVLKGLHHWSRSQGYNFTYLIGYSTGGVAAAYEVAVNDPDMWAAPDGAVIISAPVEGLPGKGLESMSHANNVKANLEMLYGGIWSDDLWPQGLKFYDNAPNGTKAPWYLKEWHFFPDSSHGVWEKEKDGAHYNNDAYNKTARFIERSKSPFDKVTKWNDGGIEVVDEAFNHSTEEQEPKTPGANFTTKAGSTLKVKVWLYNCTALDNCSRSNVSDIRVDLYSSEGYIDSLYTNTRGYEEFTLTVPKGWENRTIKIFAKLGGDFREKYTPTVTLYVVS